MHTNGVDTAHELNFNQVALDAGHHRPDVQEREDGKENAPHQRQRNANQCRQQSVAPILGDGKCGEACFPHAVKAVGPSWLCNDIFKLYLYDVVIYVLRIPIYQIYLLRMNINLCFLNHAVVIHVFVIWFVDVALFSNERCLDIFLFWYAVLESARDRKSVV